MRPGDVVALHAPNSAAFVALFHGILRAGATVTTVNSLYTADDIQRQLTDSHAGFVVTVSVLQGQMLAGARAAGVDDDRIVVADGADGFTSLADLLGENRDAPDVTIDPATHLAVLPYSSGTTGLAKGVMLTHRNLVANVAQSRVLIRLDQDDVVAAVLPFFHIYGMTVLLNLSLRHVPGWSRCPGSTWRSSSAPSRAGGAPTCSSRRRSRSPSPATRWWPSTTCRACTRSCPARPRWTVRSRTPSPSGSGAGWCRATG